MASLHLLLFPPPPPPFPLIKIIDYIVAINATQVYRILLNVMLAFVLSWRLKIQTLVTSRGLFLETSVLVSF